jgi:hypothetical protein
MLDAKFSTFGSSSRSEAWRVGERRLTVVNDRPHSPKLPCKSWTACISADGC